MPRIVASILVFIICINRIVWYEALALAFSAYTVLDLIHAIGKRVPFPEVTAVIATLTWIAMPVVAYEIFNEYHELSVLWVTYMVIPAPEYFAYTLPATMLFVLGLKLPLLRNTWSADDYKRTLRQHLDDKPFLGLYLIAAGIAATFLVKVTPAALQNVVYNFAYLTYVGMFYVIYSPFEHKARVILICAGLTVFQSVASGMYGQLIFMSVISSLILLAGKNVRLFTKLAVMASGVLLIFFIQSIKMEYRQETWQGLERRADPALFGRLVWERITAPSEIFQPERLFNLTVRANQGNIVSKAMSYVPKFEAHANGRTIVEAIGASIAPRFLWPDKPRSGGADMVCRYLGDCLSASRGLSYNVGPIGEAYINFGVGGGIIFMLCYGLLFNVIFHKTLLMCRHTPSLMLWFPLLFISFFTMENDVLSFLNTFTKSAFFTFLMFRATAIFLKVRL
jgi:hypothetical protein